MTHMNWLVANEVKRRFRWLYLGLGLGFMCGVPAGVWATLYYLPLGN